jgi:hypothetical protein
MFFKIRCIRLSFWRSKFLGFTRSTLASHICSTDSIPWVHHSREEGSLDYDGGFVHLQVHLNFNTNIYRQQAPFSGVIVGEQVIKIRLTWWTTKPVRSCHLPRVLQLFRWTEKHSKVLENLDTASTLTKHYFTRAQSKAIMISRNYLNHNQGT